MLIKERIVLIYVKIVGKDSNKETKNRVFATNFICYKKRLADSYDSFIKESRGSCISDCYFPIDKPFEYLELEFIDPDTKTERILAVPESSVYLLNTNGRTIDSIHCDQK
jgi:hypothetical protein